ncbi:estrogen receptor beta [Tetranychus urticae]|uniref:Nuclear receptor domain-containing protein n=1 Tax=Tetranychus urticae TaxID=32264 RepID=T1L4L2_TETUR|nr:estrogen receptor beta [Tetranychus urticae]XP_015793733.1 estrogen receptor beta [Tetranychus urticae]XP_015793734.1 estrogen receptor beta [Tetranychus urticae]XP_015793735.1 estrogen receptor beta [Tetranychus urticae]
MIVTNDDRECCRSLVCDSNGIIIAEMVYRCMICAYITDSICDAQRHYQIRHMETDVQPSSSTSNLKSEPLDSLDEEDDCEEAEPSGSSPSNARGGFVTCAVCHITKFYASVQRRYGQFTCMGCAKFFGRFLLKPRKYCCPNLGNCPLDATPRCKACLLQACIDTYQIDEKRMKIVNANRPVRKLAVNRQPSSSNNNTTRDVNSSALTTSSLPITHSNNDAGLNSSTSDNNRMDISPQKTSILGQQLTSSSAAGAIAAAAAAAASSSSRSRTSNTAVLALLRSTGKKNWGCRKCAGCLVEDCGKCNYCLDKPKFGGANTLKKKCIQRKCLLQEQQKLEQAQNSLRNALK